MAAHYTQTFLRDARALLTSMKDMGTGFDLQSKPEIARTLHSLKSGAAFLGWYKLEEQAHLLEDILSDPEYYDFDWSAAAFALESLINTHEAEISRDGPDSGESQLVRFTDLERKILEDSRKRGELFYRLSCRIDRSEPLPYPRAYLLANNLEKIMTLVKTEPSITDTEADFSRISFWLTTEFNESRIFGAADVDLVEVVELLHLDYSDVLEGEVISLADPVLAQTENEVNLLVDQSVYGETLQIAEELAWRLERHSGSPEAALAFELRRTLESLAYSPVEPLFNEMEEAVSTLAERRGLKARFEYSTASMGLDSGTLEILGEMLRQLIRNSLRHGVESPDQRLNAGKEAEAVLYLDVRRSGKSYRFSFQDDGRGIDEDAVYEKAKRDNIDTDSLTLLDILCSPGFSTGGEPDLDGGRGLGLEMMRHMARSEFNSDLELENRPGLGVKLSWNLAEKLMRHPYLVFRFDERSWAIPSSCIVRRGAMDPARIDAAGQSYRLGERLLPIVGPTGLQAPGTVKSYVLEIRHRGRRAALIVDDLLSEEPWGPEDLVSSDPAGPWGRSLADARDGIPIITPALVYAADSLPTGV